jgi:hypothetical protein
MLRAVVSDEALSPQAPRPPPADAAPSQDRRKDKTEDEPGPGSETPTQLGIDHPDDKRRQEK